MGGQRFQSVRGKVLRPMAVACLAMVLLAYIAMHGLGRWQGRDRVAENALTSLRLINYAAEAVDNQRDLQRIINSMGGEENVDEIVVVGGEPLAVIASTRNRWIGQLADQIDDPVLLRALNEAKALHGTTSSYDGSLGMITASSPMLLSRPDVALSHGAVAIRLKTRSIETQAALWATALGLGFSVVAVIAVLGIWRILEGAVLGPLRGIADAISHTDDDAIYGQSANDELGVLVSALNQKNQLVLRGRREMALRQQILESVIESDITGYWDWRIDQGEVYLSPAWRRMLGLVPDGPQGTLHDWARLMDPRDRRALFEAFKEYASQANPSQTFAHEMRMVHQDGTTVWVICAGRIIERSPSGAPLRMVGCHIDITRGKQAEAEMVAAQKKAEAASAAKSDFLANMSHEIRTPMTAILGYADLLDGESGYGDDPKRSAEAFRAIRSNASHLLTIINDILDVSKIEAGQMAVESIATQPTQIVEEVASLVRPRAKDKGVSVHVCYDTPIPLQISCDPTRLRQILLNLCGNAIKFTEKGSVSIHVGCDADDQAMWFSVVDTGIGMTEEQREHIARFEAFSQADTSTTRKYGGSGLGLRISNSLAKMLGGGIDLKSQLGIGSKFTLTIATGDLQGVEMHEPDSIKSLLLAQSDENADEAKTSEVEKPLLGLRILLAEDGVDNQRLIAFHLRGAGAEVDIQSNGRLAVDAMHSTTTNSPFDLVLMDMQMPELDGYSATGRLRQEGHQLPIIALTAHAMDGDRQRCLDAGCDDYLTKPIDKSKLIETCRRWAAKQGQYRAA